jgi:solute carrier family 25 citrate transporter 1
MNSGPCLNCPLDVIKTRLMGQKIEPGQAPKYRGVAGTIRTIYTEEGAPPQLYYNLIL